MEFERFRDMQLIWYMGREMQDDEILCSECGAPLAFQSSIDQEYRCQNFNCPVFDEPVYMGIAEHEGGYGKERLK